MTSGPCVAYVDDGVALGLHLLDLPHPIRQAIRFRASRHDAQSVIRQWSLKR